MNWLLRARWRLVKRNVEDAQHRWEQIMGALRAATEAEAQARKEWEDAIQAKIDFEDLHDLDAEPCVHGVATGVDCLACSRLEKTLGTQ